MSQIARIRGIYRCTGLGETKFCKPGEDLPECSCEDGGTWEFLKGDNILPKDAIVIIIGRQGVFHAIITDELPEVDKRLNIRNMFGYGLNTGEHRITLVEEEFRCGDKSYIRIEVERIGDLLGELPIHQATRRNC